MLNRPQLDKLKLCFLVPASPNDAFYSQLAMFSVALEHLGGIYQSASIVAVFGDSEVGTLPVRWRPWLQRLATYWVAPENFQKNGYLAQGDARWLHIPADSDFVIFMDADTMLLRPIDDLLDALIASPAVAGVIAHLPFPLPMDEQPEEKWRLLARQFVGRDIPLEYTHAFADEDTPLARRHCPFYLNFGCVIAPSAIGRRIGPAYLDIRPRVADYMQMPYFSGQVALTLAIYANDIPRKPISIRYNFPNDTVAEILCPDALKDMRVIHYLRTHNFDRQKIFATREEFERFLQLELSGSEQIFQEHVRRITGSRYPF